MKLRTETLPDGRARLIAEWNKDAAYCVEFAEELKPTHAISALRILASQIERGEPK